MFEFAEVAFDDIAPAVDGGIDRALDLAIALGRDVGASAACGDKVDDRSGVIAAIGDERFGGRQALDQRLDRRLVGRLACREGDAKRQAVLIDQRVDLGAQSATRTADGVIRTPFLPPAACW